MNEAADKDHVKMLLVKQSKSHTLYSSLSLSLQNKALPLLLTIPCYLH